MIYDSFEYSILATDHIHKVAAGHKLIHSSKSPKYYSLIHVIIARVVQFYEHIWKEIWENKSILSFLQYCSTNKANSFFFLVIEFLI